MSSRLPKAEVSALRMPTSVNAIRIGLAYAVLGAVWIALSDRALRLFVSDPARLLLFETIKGWAFVAVTALLLTVILDRGFHRIRRSTLSLLEREQSYREIFNASSDAIFVHDADTGRVLDVNDAMVRMYGFASKRDALASLDAVVWTGHAPFDWEGARERIRLAITEGTQLFEWLARRENGERFWVEVSLTRSQIDGQRRVLAVVRDITMRRVAEEKRRQAEDALRRNQATLDAALESMTDAVSISNRHGQLIECNDAFASFYRFAGTDGASGCPDVFPMLEVTAADGRVVPGEEWVASRALRGESGSNVRYHLRRRDTGESWTGSYSFAPIRERDGAIVGSVVVARDITDQEHADQRLIESERRFRTLVETAPEAIFVRTGDHFGYVNQAAVRLFGASYADQLLGKPVADRFHPDCRAAVMSRIQQLDTAGEATRGVDRVFLRLDGSSVDANVSAVPISFQGVPSALVIARDITDRKQIESALRQQLQLQTQLSQIAATVPGTIYSFLLRPDGTMAMPFSSSAVEDVFGVTDEEVRHDAAPIMRLIHPDDAARVHASILESARTLSPWREEFRARTAPKGDIWVEGHSVPQRQADGSVLWHGFLHDITLRKVADDKLRKLSRAVEQSPVSIVITDVNAQIEYVNPKFTQLTGYTLEDVRGQNPRILKSGTTSAPEYDQMWRMIRSGRTWHGEFQNRKKNGEMFWELATISPVTDDVGRTTHFLAVKEDITERKKLEAQFRQSQKLEAIGRLAGGVAHDFNNILAAMMLQSEVLATAADVPVPVQEGLLEMRRSTERAAALTRQLLLFSRKQVLQPRDVDLNDVVTQLAKMLQRLIREDIRLELHLHSGPVITYADPGMLDQVLMNLAVNARDAMPNGGRLLIQTDDITVDEASARRYADGTPGDYVRLTVTDTGCGMTQEVLAQIFEPFFTTKEPGKGTGLGLATVFGIVKQHKGWIAVESAPKLGTSFQVFLPAHQPAMPVPAADVRSEPRGGHETILLVEDDAALRKVTRVLLEQYGYQVLEADCGREGLRLARERAGAIALLLTDLVMPGGMTGQQLAGVLRAEMPTLKVIYTSGYSAEIAGTELRLHQGELFLQKPSQPARLLEAIRQTLDGSSPAPPAQ